MSVVPWTDATTEYVDLELHIRDLTPLGYPARLSVSTLGTFTDTLAPPPPRGLRVAAQTNPVDGKLPFQWYGQRLFEWVFGGGLRSGFQHARLLIADSAKRWRFRLRLGDSNPEPSD